MMHLRSSAPLRLRSSAPCTPAASLHACRVSAHFTPARLQELADSHAVPDVEFVLNEEPPVETRRLAVPLPVLACARL